MRGYLAGGSCGLLAISVLFAGGGAPRKEDVPKYMKMLDSKSSKDRALAAKMLGERGGININDVKEAVEPLKTLLQKDADGAVRKAAAQALGTIGAEPTETVTLLINTLKKEKEALDVKLAAVEALTQFGPNAKPALPAIRDMMGKLKDNKAVQAQLKTAVKAITAK